MTKQADYDNKTRGLYHKFQVERTDGTSASGQKHDGCQYFVLDLTHDPHAYKALKAYIESCQREFPILADDLTTRLIQMRRDGLGQSKLKPPPQPRSRAADEWRPIESAPKDADVLLLFLDGSGVQPGYWDGDRWLACETQCLTGGGWHAEPSHWMPLPPAPGEQEPT